MSAGELKERIELLRSIKKEDNTGDIVAEYEPYRSIRASRRNQSYKIGNGLNAKEEFIEQTLVFKVRNYPFIKYDLLVKYEGSIYQQVSPPERDYRGGYLTLIVKKVNE